MIIQRAIKYINHCYMINIFQNDSMHSSTLIFNADNLSCQQLVDILDE